MTVRLQTEPFDPGELLSSFCRGRGDVGAVVSFTGLVRAEGDTVLALELEAYPGFTEGEIARIAAAAVQSHNLIDVLIVHRIGHLPPGDPIVLVATAASHRRAAFEAADRLMDYLKTRAPFWKKSHEAGGARWIEPRPADYRDAERWADRDAAGERDAAPDLQEDRR